MSFNKKLLLLILSLLFIGLIYFFSFRQKPVDKFYSKVKINETYINLELAKTQQEHYTGLSNRKSIPDNFGLLFLFNKKEVKNFLMRDMLFSLDIVFIDDNKIIDIYSNLPFNKDSQNISYKSSGPVDKVLELNSGTCEKNNIKVGNLVKFLE